MNTIKIDQELLRQIPLALPTGEVDKDTRGSVLAVGGSRKAPGAIILSGRAALRVGAGRVQIALPKSLSVAAGFEFLECGVCGFTETGEGNPAKGASARIVQFAKRVDAIVIGPGLMEEKSAKALTLDLLADLSELTFIIDALAFLGLWSCQAQLRRHSEKIILTPHAGEMAQLSGMSRADITTDPIQAASKAAERLSSVIVLKGSTTVIATPDGSSYRHEGGAMGLATAGSGDVLAGFISGLAARGATPLHAAIWGVYLHGACGMRLTQRKGAIGFLASEIAGEVPMLLEEFAS